MPRAASAARRRLPQDRGGGALREAAQVLAEPGRDRAPGAALQALHEPADHADAILEREPGVALAPRRATRELDVPTADPERGDPTGGGGEPAGGGHGVEQREAERGDDRGCPEVALDPLEDGGQRGQLAGRVEVQQLVGQGAAAVEDREAVDQPPADLGPILVQRPTKVRCIEGRLPLLAPAELVAAHRAAVVLADRAGSRRPAVLVGGLGGPGQLVQHDGPVAGRAPARVPVADPLLEAGLPARGGGERLDCGVEVAKVGRAEHDLREEAVERRGFEADGLALPVDRRAGHPPTAAEGVEDDVARRGAGVQAGVDQRRRRRRDGTLEGRETEPRLGSKEERSTRHASIVADGRLRVAGRAAAGAARRHGRAVARRGPGRAWWGRAWWARARGRGSARRERRARAGARAGAQCRQMSVPRTVSAIVRQAGLSPCRPPACAPGHLPSHVHGMGARQPARDDCPGHGHLARARHARPDTVPPAAR